MNDSPADYGLYRSVRHFGSLDGLRCASILGVIWHHAYGAIPWWPGSARGFLGVDMFFVISGYLIVTLLLRERDSRGAISLRRFYARRSLRIFPPYYATLIFLALVFWFILPDSKSAGPYFDALPYYLTYTSNWISFGAIMGISWSLATEEQFYLLWPPVERFLRRGWLWVVLGGAIIVNQLVAHGVLIGPLESLFGANLHDLEIAQATFTPICLGVVMAHLLHHRRTFEWLAPWLGRRASPLFALVMLLVVANLPGGFTSYIRTGVQVSMMLLVGAVVMREDHRLAPLLQLPPIRRLGIVSYGVYLYHMLGLHVGLLVMKWLDTQWRGVSLVVCFGVTWIIAELSYRWFETPFLRIKDRFFKSNKPAPKGQTHAGAAPDTTPGLY